MAMAKAKQFRFGMKAFKRGNSPIQLPQPPQLVAQLLRMNPELFGSNVPINYRKAARTHNRLMEWAAKKSTGELVDAIGRLAWERTYYQDAYKFAAENADNFRALNRSAQVALKGRRKSNSKGGKNRHARSPAGRAKLAAQALWDERQKAMKTDAGKRQGLRVPSAPELFLALELRGYEAAYSSVAKWVTTLRSGKRLDDDDA